MPPSTDSAFLAPRTRYRWLVLLGIAMAAIVAAHLLDRVVWQDMRDLRVNDRDWGRLLRSMGYLPTWIVIGVAFWLHDRNRTTLATGWAWRGGLFVVAPTLAGALAEVMKIAVRRLRPSPDLFAYEWRPYSEALLSTRGLGMPSSHVAVAFAGATILACVFPSSRWLWYLLAAGCAATRLLALGHFLSDTVVAAMLGIVVGLLLSRAGGFGRSLRALAERADA